MINEQLKELYISSLPGLSKMYSNLDSIGEENYVGPLLLYCWEEQYLSSKHHLMIIGQETDGWLDDYIRTEADVECSIQHYKSFSLGKNSNKISLFWRYAYDINYMINGSDNLNFVWNNVNKFGIDGKGKPSDVVLAEENANFNLLQREIDIVSPDICIFVSGPNYDNDLKKKIPDLTFEPFYDYTVREASRLLSSHLPKKSYRIYHPRYGNMHEYWYYRILDKIVIECNS